MVVAFERLDACAHYLDALLDGGLFDVDELEVARDALAVGYGAVVVLVCGGAYDVQFACVHVGLHDAGNGDVGVSAVGFHDGVYVIYV